MLEYSKEEINNILYNTLKEILKLQDGCQRFVLEVDVDSFPIVTQSCNIGAEKLFKEGIKNVFGY